MAGMWSAYLKEINHLMKLRGGFSNTDLALRFDVSESTVSNVVISWKFALHEVLVKGLLSTIPSRH